MMPCSENISHSYLRNLGGKVSIQKVKTLAKRSPDCSQFGRGYLDFLSEPLKLYRFPENEPDDLNFFLGNLLIGTGAEAASDLPKVETLYLASYYLYLTQRYPRGLHLESIAVRVSLEAVWDLKDREMILLFSRFLLWLVEGCSPVEGAESFFIRLGYAICENELSSKNGIFDTRDMKRFLPSWVNGNVGRLTDDPDFPQSWDRVLRRIGCGEEVALLIGWSDWNQGSDRSKST